MLDMLSKSRGFTLVELMVTVAIMGILLAMAIPTYSTWMQNTRVRNTAEGIVEGLNKAKNEAVRRNALVRFTLVDNLTSACQPLVAGAAVAGGAWVVSRDDPSAACGAAVSDTTVPRIIATRSSNETSRGVLITVGAAGNDAFVVFNGMGRVVQTLPDGTALNPATQMMVDADTAVLSADKSRELRVVINVPGGGIRSCDPSLDNSKDPRAC